MVRFLIQVAIQLVVAVLVFLGVHLFLFGGTMDAQLVSQVVVFGVIFVLVDSLLRVLGLFERR